VGGKFDESAAVYLTFQRLMTLQKAPFGCTYLLSTKVALGNLAIFDTNSTADTFFVYLGGKFETNLKVKYERRRKLADLVRNILQHVYKYSRNDFL